MTVTKTEYVYSYLPETFLADCPITEGQPGMTFRQIGALARSRKTDTQNCNAQLRRAREYQAEARRKEVGMP